jgi:hypothetical protein
VCMCVRVCMCMCVYVYVCVCMCVYTYTHQFEWFAKEYNRIAVVHAEEHSYARHANTHSCAHKARVGVRGCTVAPRMYSQASHTTAKPLVEE